MHLAGARILIVGAGGVARAAAFGLKNKGAEVFLTNRTAEKGQTLARQAKVKYVKRADVAKQAFDVIINATPVGMNGNKQSPLEEKELNTKYRIRSGLHAGRDQADQDGHRERIQVIPGLEMFVQQGARQFEIWTGKPAPIAEMAYVVTKALERRAAEEVAEETKAPAKKATKKSVKTVRGK